MTINLKELNKRYLYDDRTINHLLKTNRESARSCLNYIMLILPLKDKEDYNNVYKYISNYVDNLVFKEYSFLDFLNSLNDYFKPLTFKIDVDNLNVIKMSNFDYLVERFCKIDNKYLTKFLNCLVNSFYDSLDISNSISLHILKKLKYLQYKNIDALYGDYYFLSPLKPNCKSAITYYKSAIKNDDKSVYRNLASIYKKREGFIDLDLAIKYYKLGVKEKDALCAYELGDLYYNNIKNYGGEKALKYYKKAYDLGYKNALIYISNMYLVDNEIKDVAKAIEYLNKAIKLKTDQQFKANCYHALAKIYLTEKDFTDIDKTIGYFKQAAKLGDNEAYIQLGKIYVQQLGYIDIDKSLYFTNKAIENGYYKGYLLLGFIYDKFKPIQNYDKAIFYYEKAIENGVENALLPLSLIYLRNKELNKYDEGVRLFKIAEKKNIGRVKFFRAKYYLYDENHKNVQKAEQLILEENTNKAYREMTRYYCFVEKNINKALEMATKFAKISDELYVDEIFEFIFSNFENVPLDILLVTIEKLKKIDNSNSNKILGDIYKNKKLPVNDFKKVVPCYLRALELDRGNEKCYQALGYCYYYGLGVEKDLIKSYEYFKRSIKYNGECDYIIKFIELAFNNSNIEIKDNVLNENTTYDELVDLLKTIFKNKTIPSNVYQTLLSALLIFVNYSKIEKLNNINLDYSPCIMMLFKTVENVIRKYFIDDYQQYLLHNVEPRMLFTNTYFVYKTDAGTYDYRYHGKFEKFTLNDFKKIVGYSKYTKTTVNDIIKSFNSNLLNSDENESVITFDNSILEYLSTIFYDKWHYKINKYDELRHYLCLLTNYITDAIDTFRNPAVHFRCMTKNDAIIVINDVLFEKKILAEFFMNLK